MSRYKTRPDPRQRVKPNDSLYEPEVDWEPRGEPYAHMVLRIHRENQRTINTCERAGYFEPVCPWFDTRLNGFRTWELCHYDAPVLLSCSKTGCPSGWLS